MTDTFIATSSENLGDLGTVVNDWSPADAEPVEGVVDQHPEELTVECEKVVLWFTPEQFDGLYKAAAFAGIDIEEHCANILVDSLVTKVGAPKIFAPANLSGQKTGFVTAPTFATDYLR
jgi:hypothetical protein